MTPPALTDQTLDNVCDADKTRYEPWRQLTRHETAVNLAGGAILHGWREPFNLWEAVTRR